MPVILHSTGKDVSANTAQKNLSGTPINTEDVPGIYKPRSRLIHST